MHRFKLAVAALSALAFTAGAASAAPAPKAPAVKVAAKAHAMKGQELAANAKIDLASARAIALEARPGKITDQELEKEAGGSGLRYSFDIKVGKATWEVGVDAATGKVLENAKEGAHPD